MCMPYIKDPYNPNPNQKYHEGLKKFSFFKNHGQIALLFEGEGHVGGNASASGLDYFHNETTNVLMLDGVVNNYKSGSSGVKNVMLSDTVRIRP